MKDEFVRCRIEPELKQIFKYVCIKMKRREMTEVLNCFIKYVILHKDFPEEINIMLDNDQSIRDESFLPWLYTEYRYKVDVKKNDKWTTFRDNCIHENEMKKYYRKASRAVHYKQFDDIRVIKFTKVHYTYGEEIQPIVDDIFTKKKGYKNNDNEKTSRI